MTHDDERRYHEKAHAGYMFQQRSYGSKADLDAILEAKTERENKEWKPAFLGFKIAPTDKPKLKE